MKNIYKPFNIFSSSNFLTLAIPKPDSFFKPGARYDTLKLRARFRRGNAKIPLEGIRRVESKP